MKQLLLLVIAGGALIGCAAPGTPPAAAANAGQPVGQACSACIVENPGNVAPCERTCHAPASDSAGAWAGAAIH